ncbi:ribonuclease H [Leifsonia sp. YIM 134122]|uniref:Ribonuclease H n=1 Tax=Leifsonia stereocauli TaxID=3134136 RepID=A0ABU9W005_9MICO
MTITAAADGSALGNPGPAGWSWYVDDDRWAAGGWKHATNNIGELTAVLELFRSTAHLDEDLLILCDSQYVINSVTKWMPGWKRKGWRKGDGKPVMNLELIQELDAAIAGRRYRFEWVKGHAGHPLNEAADERARAAAEAYQRGRPVPSGPGFPGAGTSETDAAAPVAPASSIPGAPAAASARPKTQLSLFDDEPAAEPLRAVTVHVSADEHARLSRSARDQGITLDEALRRLI